MDGVSRLNVNVRGEVGGSIELLVDSKWRVVRVRKVLLCISVVERERKGLLMRVGSGKVVWFLRVDNWCRGMVRERK